MCKSIYHQSTLEIQDLEISQPKGDKPFKLKFNQNNLTSSNKYEEDFIIKKLKLKKEY